MPRLVQPGEYSSRRRRQNSAAIILCRPPKFVLAMAHPQGAALFLEVINHVLLLLVDPTGERDEHESERGASNHGTQATGRWYLGVTWRPIQESTLAKQHQFERRSNFGQNDVVSRDW
jgi:hypothetical protein